MTLIPDAPLVGSFEDVDRAQQLHKNMCNSRSSSNLLQEVTVDGQDLLHVAAQEDDVNLATSLLQAGADPLARDTSGQSALEACGLHNSAEVAALLVPAVSHTNEEGLAEVLCTTQALPTLQSSRTQPALAVKNESLLSKTASLFCCQLAAMERYVQPELTLTHQKLSVSGSKAEASFPVRWMRKVAEVDDVAGPSSRPIVVFVHGLGGSKLDFVGALQTLPPQFEKVAFDFPLCGGESLSAADLAHQDSFPPLDDLDSYVDLLYQALLQVYGDAEVHPERRVSQAGQRGFVVVGHSFGARVAVKFAYKYEHLMRGHVNLEGNYVEGDGCADTASGVLGAHLREDAWVDHGATEVMNQALQVEQRGVYRWVLSQRHLSHPAAFHRGLKAMVLSQEVAGESCMAKFQALPMLEGVDGQGIPSMFVVGERSVGCAAASLAHAEQAEGVDVAVIPEAGHFMFIDNPRTFYTELSLWLLEKW